MDLVTLIDNHAANLPERDALKIAGGRTWSYGEFVENTCKAAGALAALGVGKGDRVLLLCYNTPGFAFALFGAWRLGAVVVPANHKLQGPEIEFAINDSESKVCIIDGTLMERCVDLKVDTMLFTTDSRFDGCQHFDDLLDAAEPYEGSLVDPQALAEILYTSGTTGKPKGCLHTHHSVTMAAYGATAGAQITRNDRTLLAMPIWHSAPLNNIFLGTIFNGGLVVLMREYAPKAFIENIQNENITLTFGAPIAFLAPLQLPDFSSFDMSSLRMVVCGGGPIDREGALKLIREYKTENFLQAFGMTETGPLGINLRPNDAIRKAGSIGASGQPGVAFDVRHPDGRLCKRGETGEIHISSPAAMQGYLNNEKATAEAFDERGWYKSGDVARIDEDGYLYIVDRMKDMIITGGENVYSKEVEDAILEHPDVIEAAVIGRPHPDWGETVVGIIVAKTQMEAKELSVFLSARLAKYKVPRTIEFMDALPRNPTGKVLKHMLRDTKK